MSVWSFPIPVLGFVAWSGTGKTTLMKKILPRLCERGIRPAVIKHAHHHFDIDHPGKDSYELRHAGADQLLIASRRRWALMVETETGDEPDLATLLGQLDLSRADLILVEGFKHESYPKIEVHRHVHNKPMLYTADPDIIAVVSDTILDTPLPCLDINDPASVTEFVIGHCLGN